jgi:citrate synthase
MNTKEAEETSRPIPTRIHTAVGAEVADPKQGTIHLCHGYDLYNDLLGQYSWLELTILHLKGELPSKEEVRVLDLLFSCVINPGPKHHATQAAMTAAVTHTPVGNSLLAGLTVLEGRYQGALEIEQAMHFLDELARREGTVDQQILTKILSKYSDIPGFSRLDRTQEKRVLSMLKQVEEHMSGSEHRHLQAAPLVASHKEVQLTSIGLFAAGLGDLGYTPRQGHGLYMIAAAPGILAHLLEQMEGDWRSYPFGSPLEYIGPQDRQLTPEQCCYKRDK